jgi:double-stranded uracil-DNA glycosylase
MECGDSSPLSQSADKSAHSKKAMPHIQSFPPIADATANILILGSMPGRESLHAGQYYAHRRNAFWTIMGELVGATPALPYAARTQKLKSAGIALWDVLASCTRHSSMDADIDAASIRPNDFSSFLKKHPNITHVFFNGSTAEKCFRIYVQPLLAPQPGHRSLHYQRLPSTSPAHASMTYEQKLNAWKLILQYIPARHPDGRAKNEFSQPVHIGH